MWQGFKEEKMIEWQVCSLRSVSAKGFTPLGEVARFRSIKQAISYSGLCGAEKNSADIAKRTPISKQRNKHIQSVLVEAAR
jgi:transposase